MPVGLKGAITMFELTKPEAEAVCFVLNEWCAARRFNRIATVPMGVRFRDAVNAGKLCAIDCVLPSEKKQQDVVVEILYDFLVVETMNQVRGLLSNEELRRIEN